jgi:hypothetical protein
MSTWIHIIVWQCYDESCTVGKNKFEVMYTREQVHYKEENIMEFALVT